MHGLSSLSCGRTKYFLSSSYKAVVIIRRQQKAVLKFLKKRKWGPPLPLSPSTHTYIIYMPSSSNNVFT